MSDNNGKHETRDCYLSAYLRLRGFQLVGARVEGRVVFFQFNNSQQLKEAEDEYWDRKPVYFAPLNWLGQIRRVRAVADETLKEMCDEQIFETSFPQLPS